MKLKKKNKLTGFIFLLFTIIAFAQNPNWSINRADFEFQMRFTAVLKFDGVALTNPNDQVGVFVGNELRGFGNVTLDTDDNKYVAFFTALANTTGETLNFKIYNSQTNTVINAIQTQTFSIDERVGGVFQSFVISNTTLNTAALFTSFGFQGITASSTSRLGNAFTIVLPQGTDLTSLTPVFSVSLGAKVFINFVKQISGNANLDFSESVAYQVVSEDEKVVEEYVIHASVALSSNHPTVVLSTTENTLTNKKQFQINIAFSEVITGFSEEDFELLNAMVSNLNKVDTTNYTALITIIEDNNTTITVKQNRVLNSSSVGNFASNTLSFLFDSNAPIVESQAHFSTERYFEVTFSEAVQNVTIDDFILKGSFSSEYVINNLQKISDAIYKVFYSGSSTENKSLFLEIKGTTDIEDTTGNQFLNQQQEAYFLNNTDNYFVANSGNWSNTSNWSLARLPFAKDRVIINENANSVADVNNFRVQKITNLGATTVNKSNSIIVDEFDNSGIFTLISDRNTSGNLLIKTKTTGAITFKKEQLLANKWHLIAVPVQGQKIKAFAENSENEIRTNTTVSPVRYAIGYYDDLQSAENKWQYFTTETNPNEVFTNAKGYAISRETDGGVSALGTLNIEDVEKTLVANSWNAIGNPYTTYYPLNKNAEQNFITENIDKLQIPATYAWDSIQEKYVAYTNLAVSETNFIPAGKGFFVKTNNSTSVEFKRDDRLISTISSKAQSQTPFLTLTVSNNKSKVVNTSVVFSKTASLSFDKEEDIENFEGALFDVNTRLVENANGKNYTIQSLSEESLANVIIPLNLKASKNDDIVFTLNSNNLPDDVKVYLEDKEENVTTRIDLENATYSVSLKEDANGTGRFFIHTTKLVLGTHFKPKDKVRIYNIEKALYISGLVDENVNLKIYDVLGKQVFKTSFYAEIENTIQLPNLQTAVYLAEIISKKGRVHKKILID